MQLAYIVGAAALTRELREKLHVNVQAIIYKVILVQEPSF